MHPLVEQLVIEGGGPGEAQTAPWDVIAQCLEQIDTVRTDLLALVERAADGALTEEADPEPGVDPQRDADLDRAFFAVHILAAARETRLCAPLRRLLRRPEDELDAILGDATTATLPGIIISCFEGGTADLLALARDPEVDGFVRGGCLGAIAFMTWEGRIDAASTRSLLARIDEERLLPVDDFGWVGWAEAIALLGWSDMTEAVERAMADGRLMDELFTQSEFRSSMADSLAATADDGARFEAMRLGYLDDLRAALSWIDHPARERESGLGGRVAPWDDPDFDDVDALDEPPDTFTDEQRRQYLEGMPVTNPLRHVGRNDPCPCGSGKKYKKCCLAITG